MKKEAVSRKGNYYIFDNFLKHGCLAAFSRSRLNLGFDNNPYLEENRKSFLEQFGISHKFLVCLQQAHGNEISLASGKDKGRGCLDYGSAIVGCDGLVTAEKGLPMAVFTADCLSVFLYDIEKKIASVVHAGWRGTRKDIVNGALKMMEDAFSSRLEDIICGFGPAIRSCCYKVGPEFRGYFSSGLIKRRGRLFLDLIGLNYSQLTNKGLPKGNIIDSGICTSCESKEFFSYRREGRTCGRMMSMIMITS